MNFFVENWPLVLMALASGGLLVWPLVKGASSASGAVSTAEAVRQINREKAVLIDVSNAAEFAAGHANGARNVPLADLEGHKSLPSNKALPVLVLCANGSRAARAAQQLRKAGFDKAMAVAGGTAGWREAQLPVEKSA